MTTTYIVTFRLGAEVVTSRHKTLRAARKCLAKKATRWDRFRYKIYRAVSADKRARGVAVAQEPYVPF